MQFKNYIKTHTKKTKNARSNMKIEDMHVL